MQTDRVAEVVVGGGRAYGTGYRISARLVLTAGHLLDAAGARSGAGPVCEVRLGGRPEPLTAEPVWRADGPDLALLRLAAEDAAAAGTVRPAVLGELPAGVTGSVPFAAIGFPAYAQRSGDARLRGLERRDSRRIDGAIQLGSNLKSGLLDLSVTSAPPVERSGNGPDPWSGMSGAALFVEDGAVLVGVQGSRLPAAGSRSAEAEPVTAALADPEFRGLLAREGVPPAPVPVEVPGTAAPDPLRSVLAQQELVEGFADFKKNLTPERLPFVSPGSDHPADPENLFQRLVTRPDRGVLLVGAAGTGKTRTGLETGRCALAAGWRVLHSLPGEDAHALDRIAEEAFAETGPVLVVVDYFNDSSLDLPAIRHRFLPEAARRGVVVALLASVRPGWLQRTDRALLHEVFDEVELRQDDAFQLQVTGSALEARAPTAVRKLGRDRMVALCGRRPIVALLVGREVERRVAAGLELPDGAGFRASGELPSWLERRLGEDGLGVGGRTDAFRRARAAPVLVAAAAAAAACPQPWPEVTAAARAASVAF
ncbi:trypsin-like peptidase domain-containing protein, partial [Streptomyces sp. JJ36]|uniref:trypsin-like peptidase domain-containing protein n=1 Tax=Streptomyces sp. JJ36 TaxID=2736645 RepID=UPI001F333AF7